MRNLGLPAVDGVLDETMARQIAISQGFGVVLTGSLSRQGAGYQLSVRALEAVTGDVIRSGEATAPDREQVVTTATRLATTVRTALGDETSESAQMFAMETLNARSLDVIHECRGGHEIAERRQVRRIACEREEGCGSGSRFWSSVRRHGSRRAGSASVRNQKRSIEEAVARLEVWRSGSGIGFVASPSCCQETSRSAWRSTRADKSLRVRRDCAQQSRPLRQPVARYAEGDRGNEKGRRDSAEECSPALQPCRVRHVEATSRPASEKRRSPQLDPMFPKGFTALAFAFLGQGRLGDAANVYDQLRAINASDAASGLADIALFEGRLTDAMRLLETAAAADIAAKAPDRAADKLSLLAYTHLTRGQTRAALQAADRALANSQGSRRGSSRAASSRWRAALIRRVRWLAPSVLSSMWSRRRA